MPECKYKPGSNLRPVEKEIATKFNRAYLSAKRCINKELIRVMNEESECSLEAIYDPNLYEDR